MADKFINPYTFIPVHDGKKQSYDTYFNEPLLTGKIKCTLITRSQIAVCEELDEKEKKPAVFFNVDGNPIIMGSTLRGTIRSIYEALTDSCLSSTNAEDDDYFTSRLNKTSPGLIQKTSEGYVLFKAERYKDETHDNSQLNAYHTGDEVSFSPKKNKNGFPVEQKYFTLEEDGKQKGYVHKVDRFPSRNPNKDSIFEKKGDSISINEDSIDRLEQNLKLYSPKKHNIQEDYMKQFKRMKNGDGCLPVWYLKKADEADKYYFAPSRMSRAVFFKKPADMLTKQNLNICHDSDNVCEACALFGIVSGSDKQNFAKAGRVRFSDAKCTTEDCFDKTYQLEVLSTPRLSSFEFYLKSPNGVKAYDADTPGVTIAGRKYYWHHGKERPITRDAETKSDNMQHSAQLVKPGSRFEFYVYFERITETMLKKLMFALNLGENSEDSLQCHKLGHGKPLGLGSVKIRIEDVTIRTFSPETYEYHEENEFLKPYDQHLKDVFSNRENVRNVLKVTRMPEPEESSYEIGYPAESPKGDIFKWFASNRAAFDKPAYKQLLPDLTKKDQSLFRHAQDALNDTTTTNSYSTQNSTDFSNGIKWKTSQKSNREKRLEKKNNKKRK